MAKGRKRRLAKLNIEKVPKNLVSKCSGGIDLMIGESTISGPILSLERIRL